MRSINRNNKKVKFYEDGDFVGEIDYSKHSEHYIESAIDNWFDGILTVETVEKWSIVGNRLGSVLGDSSGN